MILNQFLATLASVLSVTEYKYPKEEIDDLWERLLLCQCASFLVMPLFSLID